ncbi:MAG: SHOCT domain-containing protein [Phycisphaerae bacterium]
MFAAQSTGDILVWGLVLIGAIGSLGAIIWMLRRRFFAAASWSGGVPWTLQQLRELRAKDQITDDEFQRLRAEMLRPWQAESAPSDEASAGANDRAGVDGNEIKRVNRDSR